MTILKGEVIGLEGKKKIRKVCWQVSMPHSWYPLVWLVVRLYRIETECIVQTVEGVDCRMCRLQSVQTVECVEEGLMVVEEGSECGEL